jgi:hypothetical protein
MTIRFSSFIFLLFAGGVSVAQPDILEEVCKAVSGGNAEKVAVYFAPQVEISFGTAQDGKKEKKEAEGILKDFFSRNPVKSFTIQHRGPKSSSTGFVIGQLLTAQGASYRVMIYVKEVAGQTTIQEMKFEKN